MFIQRKVALYLIFALMMVQLGLPVGFIGEPKIIRTVKMPIIAVTTGFDQGLIGYLEVSLINESYEKIEFDPSVTLNQTTQSSIEDAVFFAEKFTGKSASYHVLFNLPTRSISGKSSGASMAAAVIALLTDKTVINDVAITGSVDRNGAIIETGGVYQKVISGLNSGLSTIIVPQGQSLVIVYEKHTNGKSGQSYYVSRHINLTEYSSRAYNASLIEVSNLEMALPYLIQ